MLRFHCDTAARAPIYRQLIEQVRAGIARGRLQPGERLPSVRQLSKDLVVNPNTVARAYQELEREGVIYTRQGLGVFVAAPQSALREDVKRQRLVELVDGLLTEAVHLGFQSGEVTGLLTQRMQHFQFTGDCEASGKGRREKRS
jgi:GntR family transcriptional regulator